MGCNIKGVNVKESYQTDNLPANIKFVVTIDDDSRIINRTCEQEDDSC